jgi:hypothetical protein
MVGGKKILRLEGGNDLPDKPAGGRKSKPEHNVLVHGTIQTSPSPDAGKQHAAERKEDTAAHIAERDEDGRRETKKFRVEVVTLASVIIVAFLSFWQGYSAQRTADSAIVDQRPYVVVKNPGFSTPPGFVANQALSAAVTVTNIGRTPAIDVYDMVDLVYLPAPTPVPGEQVIVTQKRFTDVAFDTLAANERSSRIALKPLSAESDLAPQGEYFSANYGTTKLSQSEFEDVRSNNPVGGALFFVGLITYTDANNDAHRTEFCWYLISLDKEFWRRCKFHNIIR